MTLKKCCSKCKSEKPFEEFWRDTRKLDGRKAACIECAKRIQKNTYYLDPQVRIQRAMKWKKENWDYDLTYMKERAAKMRMQVINAYGGACVCCGESELPFLTVEHVNGGGRAHRKEVGGSSSLYRNIIQQGFPDKFTILCMNCNFASRGGRTCPHKKKMN